MPLVTLQYADLSPERAAALADRLVELSSRAQEGQFVRVHIAKGGAVGMEGLTVAAELREGAEER
jgi:hypothetical protein